MSMQDYEAATEIMSRYPQKMQFVGPRPESLIAAAEKALGLTFPPTYRRFLLEFGAGSFGSVEIYGVIHDDFEHSGVPDGIWLTLDEREEGECPDTYVVIEDAGDGDQYCLDSGKRTGSEYLVVLFEPGCSIEEQSNEVVAEDFGAFLLDAVQQQVEFMAESDT